jgi:hypothetical protein
MFQYGAHGEYLVTARELKELRRLERQYLGGQIGYRTYLSKKRKLLTLEQTGSTRCQMKKQVTPWKKIRIFGGGLPELGKR